jgi:hypothetical protein
VREAFQTYLGDLTNLFIARLQELKQDRDGVSKSVERHAESSLNALTLAGYVDFRSEKRQCVGGFGDGFLFREMKVADHWRCRTHGHGQQEKQHEKMRALGYGSRRVRVHDMFDSALENAPLCN